MVSCFTLFNDPLTIIMISNHLPDMIIVTLSHTGVNADTLVTCDALAAPHNICDLVGRSVILLLSSGYSW